MNTISISKIKVKKEGGVVILSIKEYERLQASAVPTFYLRGAKASQLDNLVKKGIKSYRAGKTKVLHSLADLK